jgi:hypothetical protein
VRNQEVPSIASPSAIHPLVDLFVWIFDEQSNTQHLSNGILPKCLLNWADDCFPTLRSQLAHLYRPLSGIALLAEHLDPGSLLTILETATGRSVQALSVAKDVDCLRQHGRNFIMHNLQPQTNETAQANLTHASTDFLEVRRTRYFLANQPALPNQPLTSFIAVSRNSALRAARAIRTKSELEFARVFSSTGVRMFEGEVERLGKTPYVITSVLPGLSIRLSNASIRHKTAFEELDIGQKVTFGLGIKGTWACGYPNHIDVCF